VVYLSDPTIKIIPGPQTENIVGLVPMQGKTGKDGRDGRDPQDIGIYTNNDVIITGIENYTVIDSFTASDWRMVKYMLSISKTSGGDDIVYSTELSVLIDGEDLNVSEYGVLDNNGDVGTVNVSKDNGNVILTVTPNPAIKPVTVRFFRTGLKA
jgi:hypothetical protein